MFLSPAEALALLEHYKYLIIFPIAVFEGPIIIIISGFLVYLKILNFYITCLILIVADIIGDSMYYLIGKYWRKSPKIKKFANFFGYSGESETYLEKHFEKHKAKTFLLAKISHGLGGSVQIASGIAGVKYSEFLFYSILGTVPKTLILIIVGFYLGSYYEKIDGYLNIIAIVILSIVGLVILHVVSKKYIKGYFNNVENDTKM